MGARKASPPPPPNGKSKAAKVPKAHDDVGTLKKRLEKATTQAQYIQ